MAKEKKSLLPTIDIEVILPSNPSVQRTNGNHSLLTDLNQALLEKICYLVFKQNKFVLKHENRQGRYIEVKKISTDEIHFICISNPWNDSRNAFLMQFIPPTFTAYYNCKIRKKSLGIYILKDKNNYKANYNQLFYRIFLTIGVSILNIDELKINSLTPFINYDDLKRYRKITSERNSNNNSTYFLEDENQVSIYGKTFGANAMESFLIALTLSKIVTKPIVFYPVVDNDSDNLSKVHQQIFEQNSILYSNENIKLLDKKTGKAKATSRNQNIFKYNLLNKFGHKQCYLCGCEIESLIIASHIERVTDIDNNLKYNKEEKIKRATDGDNGFWLCANHDKLFEYGQIYFKKEELKTKLENQSNLFLQQSIYIFRNLYALDNKKPFKIQTEHFNDKTQEYINKHFERIMKN